MTYTKYIQIVSLIEKLKSLFYDFNSIIQAGVNDFTIFKILHYHINIDQSFSVIKFDFSNNFEAFHLISLLLAKTLTYDFACISGSCGNHRHQRQGMNWRHNDSISSDRVACIWEYDFQL